MAEDDARAEPDPRRFFADQLRMLFAAAGRPALKKVESESAEVARAMGSTRPVSVQRLSDWRSGKRLPASFETVRPVLVALIRAARALNAEPPTPGLYSVKHWQAWWDRARGTSPGPGRSTGPPEPALASGLRPYRGLAAYRENDARLFFGRSESVRELVDVTVAAHGHGPVIVTGASGVGKSSLVQAGLIPELCADGDYVAVVLTPGRHPLGRLGEAIPELADPAADRADAVAVQNAIRAATARMGCSSVLIVVDQIEELFTQCDDGTERAQFLGVLERASTTVDHDDAPATVVATMRSDFYEQAVAYPVLARALERRTKTVRPLHRTDLAAVITEPAKLVGVRVESGLVDVILNDLGVLTSGEISGTELPLLSHLLDTMWDRRRGGNLTVAGYRGTGGVRGSIAASAERAWKELDERGRTLARSMLVHLVYVTTTGTDVKIARPLSQLTALGDDRDVASRVLDHFVSARVIVVDAEHAELIHDAVIVAWPRLKSWIQEDRSSAALRQQLEDDATTWVESGRNDSLLYQRGRMDLVAEQDERLARTGKERREVGGAVSPTAVAFLAASRREIDRATRRRRTIIAGLALSLIVSLVTGTLAWTAKNRAEDERSAAEFQQIIALADATRDDEPTTSAGLALAAAHLRPDSDIAYSRLVAAQGIPVARILDGHTGPVYGVAVSPDGTTLASASDDGTVRLWDMSDRSDPHRIGRPLTTRLDYTASVSFSPDGAHLAAGGGDGSVWIWDVTDRDRPVVLLEHRDIDGFAVHNVRYSPDGRMLAVPYDDGTVALVDTTAPGFPITRFHAHAGAVRTAVFRPDSSVLATTSDDRTVRLWNVTEPAGPIPIGAPLTGFGDVAHSADFDATGARLVVSSDDGILHLFDTTDITAPRRVGVPLRAHTGGVWKVQFLPDGRTIASASWDGTAKLWSVDPVAGIVDELKPGLTGNGGGLAVLTVTPDGGTVVTGGQDANIRIWTLPRGRIGISDSALTMPSIDGSGRLAATGGYDSVVNLWSIDDRGRWGPASAMDLPRPLGGAVVVALSPPGTLLATAPTSGGSVRLWDVADPRRPRPLGAPLRVDTRFTSALAFTPDGATLVTGANDRSVTLWDVTDPADPVPRGEPLTGPTNLVRSAAVSPDGRSFVVASADGGIYAWDISDPDRPVPVPVSGRHDAGVHGVSFGAGGAVLATGGDDHTVIIWDRGADGGFTARDAPLHGHTGTVYSVSVSPNAGIVASGSDDGTIRLWDVASPDAMRALGGPITDTGVGRWQVLFLPDGRVAAAGGDGMIRTWDLDPDGIAEDICASTTGEISAVLPQFELPDEVLDVCVD
ncbi:MAG: WD40 repeat domain-containing protein [Rhodococcus sp. (in: high G+C Gram-positive bacteria)]|uniref:nSTAND1 domain-containing NTPase n=1 Tax=Rhodococcus sp. TaxID=1831 RepID=UPI003BB5365B